jgi:hypothetical protein
LPALALLRKPLFGLAKRHIQPECYMQYALNWLKNKKLFENKVERGGDWAYAQTPPTVLL